MRQRRCLHFILLRALVSLQCIRCTLLQPQDIASMYSLTASFSPPFPTATLSSSDADTFLVSNWGLSKGRVQNSPQHLSFVDDPFNSQTSSNNSTSADDSPVLEVVYPADGFSPTSGGTQFYSLFNGSEPFQSMLLSYEVAFDNDFDWVKGGKLPGIRGGPDPNGCSGGSQPNGTDCFSMRLMWRPSGEGEVYAYIPRSNNICDQTGFICNPDFGISIQRGAFGFESGTWNKISLLVLLNSPVNVANGFVAVYFNDVPALMQSKLQIRGGDTISAGGLYFSTFFGGDDSSWAPASEQHSFFRNMQLWAGNAPSNLTGAAISATQEVRSHSLALTSVLVFFTLFMTGLFFY